MQNKHAKDASRVALDSKLPTISVYVSGRSGGMGMRLNARSLGRLSTRPDATIASALDGTPEWP